MQTTNFPLLNPFKLPSYLPHRRPSWTNIYTLQCQLHHLCCSTNCLLPQSVVNILAKITASFRLQNKYSYTKNCRFYLGLMFFALPAVLNFGPSLNDSCHVLHVHWSTLIERPRNCTHHFLLNNSLIDLTFWRHKWFRLDISSSRDSRNWYKLLMEQSSWDFV